MNNEQMRKEFEAWYSDQGDTSPALERGVTGNYRYVGAHTAWTTWQASWQAALATQPQAPQGAVTWDQLEAAFEAEIAKVSHVAYDSNEICRHFFNNIRTALCATPETPEGAKP